MGRTIKDIQKDIELLGIKGGYDIEQLLTPQDCRRLSYTIDELQQAKDKLQNDYQEVRDRIEELQEENKELNDSIIWWKNRFYGQQIYDESYKVLSRDYRERIDKAIEYIKEHNVIAVNKEHLPTGIERCCSAELLEILGEKENE